MAAKSKVDAKTLAKIYQEDDKGKRILIDPEVDKEVYARCAIDNPDVLEALLAGLGGEERRVRQFCATIVSAVAKDAPSLLEPSVKDICRALDRQEAITRWNALEALIQLVPSCLSQCKKTIPSVEISLDDEESGLARVAAFRFLCRMAQEDKKASEAVWPLIDEAIQCYHGDPEFQDMLSALLAMAGGNASPKVKAALAERMSFDAESGKGGLKGRAGKIVAACKA